MRALYPGIPTIPPELIGMVLNMVPERGSEDKGEEGRRRHKRRLNACSLVCTYWAFRIRPFLFEEIFLRNANDVTDLLSLIDSDSPTSIGHTLPHCLQCLIIEHSDAGAPPWLHHLDTIRRRLHNVNIEVIVASSAPARQPHVFSLDLPRGLPASMYPFTRITLHNITVTRPADLVRFVRLPMVTRCSCENVRFTEVPAKYFPMPRRRPSRISNLDVAGCGEGDVRSQMTLASAILAPREGLDLDLADRVLVGEALAVLFPSDKGGFSLAITENSKLIIKLLSSFWSNYYCHI